MSKTYTTASSNDMINCPTCGASCPSSDAIRLAMRLCFECPKCLQCFDVEAAPLQQRQAPATPKNSGPVPEHAKLGRGPWDQLTPIAQDCFRRWFSFEKEEDGVDEVPTPTISIAELENRLQAAVRVSATPPPAKSIEVDISEMAGDLSGVAELALLLEPATNPTINVDDADIQEVIAEAAAEPTPSRRRVERSFEPSFERVSTQQFVLPTFRTPHAFERVSTEEFFAPKDLIKGGSAVDSNTMRSAVSVAPAVISLHPGATEPMVTDAADGKNVEKPSLMARLLRGSNLPAAALLLAFSAAITGSVMKSAAASAASHATASIVSVPSTKPGPRVPSKAASLAASSITLESSSILVYAKHSSEANAEETKAEAKTTTTSEAVPAPASVSASPMRAAPVRTDAELLTLEGDRAARVHDFQRAGMLYERALKQNPTFVPARLGAANVEWETGLRNQSRFHYRAIIADAPGIVPPMAHDRAR